MQKMLIYGEGAISLWDYDVDRHHLALTKHQAANCGTFGLVLGNYEDKIL